jgi:hypothetical protein
MARSLPAGSLKGVATKWCNRLEAAQELSEAGDYYCGRGFQEAVAAAAALKGDLLVVSAGLGLVSTETKVPAYSLTVSAGHPDSVMTHLSDSATPSQWWAEIVKRSPFSSRLGTAKAELLIVALPGPYLEILLPALERWAESDARQIRILCRTDQQKIPGSLKSAVIAYDDRLDGNGSPIPGTMADFASRAGRHFVENVLRPHPRGNASTHRQATEKLLATYGARERVTRPKLTDKEISRLIRRHWDDVEGRSGRMLRFLRDTLEIACEQGRFRDLFRAVAATQTSKQ